MSLQFLADYTSSSKHDCPIWTIATSSKVVWSASADGAIKAWDINSGRSIGSIQSPHRNAVTSLSVSESQGWMTTNSLDGSLALWKIQSFHDQQTRLPKVDDLVAARGASSPTQEGDRNEATESMVPPNGENSRALKDEAQEVTSCLAYCPSVARMAFPGERTPFPIDAYTSDLHPNKPILATTGNTASLSLYRITVDNLASTNDSQEQSPLSTFLTPLRRFRANAVIHPKDHASASSATRSLARNPIPTSARKGWGMCVRFTPAGSMVAVGTDSGQVIVHDVESGAVIALFSNHAAPIRSLSFSLAPVLGSVNSAAAPLSGHRGSSGSSSLSDLERRLDHLSVGSEDLTLSVHDARDLREQGQQASGTVVAMLQGHAKMVVDASIRGDGRILASTSTDKTIKLWDLAASPKVCVCTIAEDGAMWCLRWINDGKFVAAGDQGVVRWYRGAGVGTSAGEDL
ncbi:WD40 repeat-like protein [Tilletiaria anomala UBC 951]|uniref:WD40 repeat-like protein n=1 Tax=Tilletiaria anomala (strain ATCC 24038 / CBS 436.72 / UBC 951) TaxID=1037660 RepID=A0A066VJ60_TILAU|nr:WD40 repeat-like protein [Tilletiaria anomala UBC 951]KDN38640.1 WD40 repeat-like protein [Tilletiaria anomala UBC 951]